MNDKGINDALLNGITECLRSLQRSSPGLLLTSQQLKKVERDVKYIPSASGAIASVICRSRLRLYDNAMDIASCWDDAVVEENTDQNLRTRCATERCNNPMQMHAEEERHSIDALRHAIERRLLFVVSEEFKSVKIADEKDLRRRNREDIETTQKRVRTKTAAEHDRMEIDCFESDDGCYSEGTAAATVKPKNDGSSEEDASSCDHFNSTCCQSQGDSSIGSSE